MLPFLFATHPKVVHLNKVHFQFDTLFGVNGLTWDAVS